MNALMRLFGAAVFNLNLDLLASYAAGVPLLAALALAALKWAQAASMARRDPPSTLPGARSRERSFLTGVFPSLAMAAPPSGGATRRPSCLAIWRSKDPPKSNPTRSFLFR
jgi:hypothetical protein